MAMALSLLCLTVTPKPSSLSILSSYSPRVALTLNAFPKSINFLSLSTSCSGSTSEAEPAATPLTSTETELPKNRLLAQNFPWDCKVEEIKALFEKHGTVVDIEISMFNKVRNRGLAFITMASEEEAQAAITNLHSTQFGVRTLNVYISTSIKKEPKEKVTSKMKHPVFVGNLAHKLKAQELRDFFKSEQVNVVSAQIMYTNRRARKSAGYAFVSFGTKEEAELAISTFNGKELMGRPVRMGFPLKKEELDKKKEIKDESVETGTNITQENVVNV